MSHWYSTACLNNHLFLFFSQLFSRLSSFFPPISFSWQLQSSPLSFLSSLAFHFILLSHSLSSSLLFFSIFFFLLVLIHSTPPPSSPRFPVTYLLAVELCGFGSEFWSEAEICLQKHQEHLKNKGTCLFPSHFESSQLSMKLKNTYVWGVGGPNLCHSGCSLHTFCFHFLRIQKTWPSLKGKKSVFSSPGFW